MFAIGTADFLLLGSVAMLIDVIIRLCMIITVFEFIKNLQTTPKTKKFVVHWVI